MKIKILQVVISLCCLFSSITLITATSAPHAQALDAGDLLGYFVETLSPHGRWSESPQYGRVWEPHDQNQRDWRPYSRGQWVYSDEYGWVWKAEEKWGEIPYHYGRWANSNNRWIWVPDRTWGPAWVAWRQNDEYIGWAPLPPEADWRGEEEWRPQDSYFSSAPNNYVIVPQRYFGGSSIYNNVVPRERNVVVLNRGQNITRYRTVNRIVRNEGPRREVIERVVGRRIEPVQYVPRVIEPKHVARAKAHHLRSMAAHEQEPRARLRDQDEKESRDRDLDSARHNTKVKPQSKEQHGVRPNKGQKSKRDEAAAGASIHHKNQVRADQHIPRKANKREEPQAQFQAESQNKKPPSNANSGNRANHGQLVGDKKDQPLPNAAAQKPNKKSKSPGKRNAKDSAEETTNKDEGAQDGRNPPKAANNPRGDKTGKAAQPGKNS